MLARTVENVYWLARYLERAEDTARLISVHTHLLLDLPAAVAPGWLPLIDITGSRALFDERRGAGAQRAEEREVVYFLVADRGNPGSIVHSLSTVRENARTLRDVLPAESWEEFNGFFMRFSEELPTGLARRDRFEFLKRSVLISQTLTGMLEGTMSRNQAHTFMALGRDLERADMTSRVIDVRCAQLRPDAAEPQAFETVQWMSVLHTLSGYEMYRLARRTRVERAGVLEFALRDTQFPRSCLTCLRDMQRCLEELPRSGAVRERLATAHRFLADAELGAIEPAALHELIDQLQRHLTAVHEQISLTYFPQPSARPPSVRQLAAGAPA
ncbi:MAG TPA: alpha-E domain-containing protein [Steroidobacteraceae bacterium]|nr:alpha-E domain-containing protein [Steroidobacteraceae bacterium]